MAAPEVFGEFARGGDAAITFESVHHLEKRVNGAPLRRPPWYFDVRTQGDGLEDIPTHLVDHAQRLVGHAQRADSRPAGDPAPRLAGAEAGPGPALELVSARCWPTLVPREVFARVTGSRDFPAMLDDLVRGQSPGVQRQCRGWPSAAAESSSRPRRAGS